MGIANGKYPMAHSEMGAAVLHSPAGEPKLLMGQALVKKTALKYFLQLVIGDAEYGKNVHAPPRVPPALFALKDSGKVCKGAETGFPARRSAPISGTGLS